jgi:hypothetical protein
MARRDRNIAIDGLHVAPCHRVSLSHQSATDYCHAKGTRLDVPGLNKAGHLDFCEISAFNVRSRPLIAPRAPSGQKAWAVAKPIPLLPRVTSTGFPLKRFMTLSFPIFHGLLRSGDGRTTVYQQCGTAYEGGIVGGKIKNEAGNFLRLRYTF